MSNWQHSLFSIVLSENIIFNTYIKASRIVFYQCFSKSQEAWWFHCGRWTLMETISGRVQFIIDLKNSSTWKNFVLTLSADSWCVCWRLSIRWWFVRHFIVFKTFRSPGRHMTLPRTCEGGKGSVLILILQMRKRDLRKMGDLKLSQNMPNPQHLIHSAYFYLVGRFLPVLRSPSL